MYTCKYICVIILIYLFDRLHLFKICLCCFLDIILYSNKLLTIARISSLNIIELFPACISCSINFYLLRNSSLFSDKNIVVTPKAKIAGDFNNFNIDLSLSLFRPLCLKLKLISLPNSQISF